MSANYHILCANGPRRYYSAPVKRLKPSAIDYFLKIFKDFCRDFGAEAQIIAYAISLLLTSCLICGQ